MQKLTLFCGVLGTILGLNPAGTQALTPQQIVQRCQRAYDALQTYQGTTTVTTTMLRHGGKRAYHTSANILFARPNKIRTSGSIGYSPDDLFAYVSDGTATYENTNGTWDKTQNTEMAIAGATGIAMFAGTTIPALLLHTNWGDPFPRVLKFNSVVGQETVGGVACYRVTGETPKKSNIYWIDSKTFLLKRYVFAFSTGKLRIQNDERFSSERLNATLPTRTFTLPAGHQDHDFSH